MKAISAAAVGLVAALVPASGFARPFASAPAALVHDTAVFCGPDGCGPVWPGPHYREWAWGAGAWDHVYRPACPIGYYYACRRGPLGYGACACWPYRRW